LEVVSQTWDASGQSVQQSFVSSGEGKLRINVTLSGNCAAIQIDIFDWPTMPRFGQVLL
jgi:hypothetical protein